MALPLLPLALGAGVIGFLLLRKKGETPAASSIAAAQANGTSIAALPPEFTSKFSQLMADPNVDPAALDTTATAFEQAGLTTQALQLRQRAAQLRAAASQSFRAPTTPSAAPAPSGPAPAPRVAPAPAPAAVLPQAVEAGLPLLEYLPDLGAVGSNAAGTYFPRVVDNDAQALRFLGFPAGSPGGGISRAEDVANKTGGFNPQFQEAVRSFQQTMGTLAVDGRIGPATRQRLAEAVNDTNATNAQINASGGRPNAVFQGLYDPMGSLNLFRSTRNVGVGGYSGRGIAFGGVSATASERRIGSRYTNDHTRGSRFSRW